MQEVLSWTKVHWRKMSLKWRWLLIVCKRGQPGYCRAKRTPRPFLLDCVNCGGCSVENSPLNGFPTRFWMRFLSFIFTCPPLNKIFPQKASLIRSQVFCLLWFCPSMLGRAFPGCHAGGKAHGDWKPFKVTLSNKEGQEGELPGISHSKSVSYQGHKH